MKKIQTILFYLVLTVSSGILMSGCGMVTTSFEVVPVRSIVVVTMAAIAILAIIVFMYRTGSRRRDEETKA